MGKNRSHKIPEERNKERIEKLASENRKLKKEVQQLRRELSRMVSREEDYHELLDEFQEINIKEEIDNDIFKCPLCSSKKVSVVKKLRDDIDYYFCQDCESRGPINVKK